MKKPLIGFVGQGWIGKNYADNFEKRGFQVVRYALEKSYVKNKDKIKKCDIVIIAVPTPTKSKSGFDDSIVRRSVALVGKGKIAVIKSTLLPGTTESIQKMYPDRIIFHSPEFLTRAWVYENVNYPDREIIGMAQNTQKHLKAAKQLQSVFPKARFTKICSSRAAELIKYARNCQGYFRVIFANLLYDLSQSMGVEWKDIEEAMAADPINGGYYYTPVHRDGRGAGGPCYIKDFAAFSKLYKEKVNDKLGENVLKSLESKNIQLLKDSSKDIDLLAGVYGDKILKKRKK